MAKKKKDSAETETLHCEAGDHEWARERKRGKKPVNCPEHAAEIKAAKQNDALAKARAVRAKQREEKLRWERENLYPLVTEDDMLKIVYIDAQVARGHREQDDVDLLNAARKIILKRAARRRGWDYDELSPDVPVLTEE